MDPNDLLQKAQDLFTTFGLKIVAVIAILIFGRWIAKALTSLMRRAMDRARLDTMPARFIGNVAYAALTTFVALAAINQPGVQTTSFIAGIGAAGMAIGQGRAPHRPNITMPIWIRPARY